MIYDVKKTKGFSGKFYFTIRFGIIAFTITQDEALDIANKICKLLDCEVVSGKQINLLKQKANAKSTRKNPLGGRHGK